MFLSDVHLNTQADTSALGTDTGMELWRAFISKLEKLLSAPGAPRFIVYTGDLPAHYKCGSTCYLAPEARGSHNADIDSVLSAFNRLSEKYHRPVFYVPGNNDALAGDYYSFADMQQQTPLSLIQAGAYFFPSAAKEKKAPCMVSNPHPTMGYYSAYPVKGLRLIALNTVIFNPKFRPVDGTDQLDDGNTEMAWLAGQLHDAAANHERVYIAMHVPPGEDAYSGKSMWAHLPVGGNDWLNQFLALTTQYSSTIEMILYGHTHMDEVRRLFDTSGTKITAIAMSCPGVTPQHYNNPGFKVVNYNAATMSPTGFTTYYTQPSAVVWGDSAYTFKEAWSNAAGASIREKLSSISFSELANGMNSIYTVKNGKPGYNTARGIDVKMDKEATPRK